MSEDEIVPLAWMVEESMLEEYFLLVRRIPGISLSVEDYWNLDTWTTAKLLDMEKKIMGEEAKGYGDNKHSYEERPDGNSEEMNDLVDKFSDD